MSKNIVILTGAGVSQESGIATFRDQNGLWENHRVEEVASPLGFARNPELVHRFYNLRRRQLREVKPNAGHEALALLERKWPGKVLLVTQNVDDLHERAGSKNILHMHGELNKARCASCEWLSVWEEDLHTELPCPSCHKKGALRPHIVWFGEVPLFMDEIVQALEDCNLFLSVGTSGRVYPAAGFVQMVPRVARKIEINANETEISSAFLERRIGASGVELPKLVSELLHAN